MQILVRIGAAVAIAAMLCACGTTGVENAALLNQPLGNGNARLKFVRAEEFVAGARAARVKLDGKQIADLGSGGQRFSM